jgi:hypothetical protein
VERLKKISVESFSTLAAGMDISPRTAKRDKTKTAAPTKYA